MIVRVNNKEGVVFLLNLNQLESAELGALEQGYASVTARSSGEKVVALFNTQTATYYVGMYNAGAKFDHIPNLTAPLPEGVTPI
jgi:hypothetical protein